MPYFISERRGCSFSPIYLLEGLSEHIECLLRESSDGRMGPDPVEQDLRRDALRYLGAEKMERFSFDSYKASINVLPQVAWIGYFAECQLDKLFAFQSLPSDAAASSIILANETPEQEQHYLGEALCLLDQGRSVMWAQASSLRADQVEDLRVAHPEIAERLELFTQYLRTSHFNVARPSDKMQARRRMGAAIKFEEIVDEVRRLNGFERFLLPLPIADVLNAACEGPIVVINASWIRCDALVIENGKPLRVIPLSLLTLDTATELTEEFTKSVDAFEEGQPNSMNSLMNRIWTFIGFPIVEALGLLDRRQSPLPRLWWCLTGQLTFLPIHACFPEEPERNKRRKGPPEPLAGMMDLVVSSYTPTVSALLRAQSQQRKAASTNKRPRSQNSFLVIAQSDEVPGGAALVNVKMEVDKLRDLSITHGRPQPTVLMNADATTQTVPKQIETCSWAHFSCHAVQNPFKPIQSAFLMSDGDLTLERLAKIPTARAQFAFLSACQTAKGDKMLPNESVHIAAGMQFVGFPSVVGTMWAIRDDDGRFVAQKFYESVYAGQEETVDVGRALHSAIQQLRKKEVSVSQWAQFIHIGVGKVESI